MSILQDISKRLLEVASLPPEQRNDALMQVLIYIETVQYDMVLEQKNLIMSVIEDLIAENDADQIAKSKLVFVEDVEEQIAPTKKTRAKKVVKPVGEDLPDFIDSFSFVKDLPEPVRKLMGLRRKQDNDTSNVDLDATLSGNLTWNNTLEGLDFWAKINNEGDLREFKKLYGNKGEKVDELIDFAELTEFVENTFMPSTSTAVAVDLPDTITGFLIIKDLPEPVKKLVLLRQKEAGNPKNENIDIINSLAFRWTGTPEDFEFWNQISQGNLKEFKRIYGNKGEGVDAIINPSSVASVDLPDTIDLKILIKDLPEPIKKLALFRQKEQNKPFNDEITILNNDAFIWNKTPEGSDFWEKIQDKGDLTEFKRIYGNKGENVDNIVNGLIGFNELLEMANKQNAQLINDAFKQAQTIKTRKTRTKTVAPVVSTQEVDRVELIFETPDGGVVTIVTDNLYELHDVSRFVLGKLKMSKSKLNFNVITYLGTYTSQITFFSSDSQDELLRLLIEKFDTFVKPELNWKKFDEKQGNIDKMNLNEEIINDAFKPAPIITPKVATPKVITPKPIKVVAPKVVTPKPVKVVAPKIVTPKPVKVVAPKVVKTKVTKPKVEDDLSFLNDLDNIF